jgi:hypothetical protein
MIVSSVADLDDVFPDPNPTFEDFRNPVLDLNTILANFLLKIFFAEICSKKYIYEPKSLATKILEVFMAFTHTKNFI